MKIFSLIIIATVLVVGYIIGTSLVTAIEVMFP